MGDDGRWHHVQRHPRDGGPQRLVPNPRACALSTTVVLSAVVVAVLKLFLIAAWHVDVDQVGVSSEQCMLSLMDLSSARGVGVVALHAQPPAWWRCRRSAARPRFD